MACWKEVEIFSHEMITKAAKQMGLYEQDNEGEREFYEHLIYENWIMFDGKMRSIEGGSHSRTQSCIT